MINSEIDIFTYCLDWQRTGQACWLLTVIRTWGSSPRPVGSMLVLREDGSVVGSVSGGCVEDDLIAQMREQQLPTAAAILSYGVSSEQASRFGLPCGGRLELLCEKISHAVWIDPLLQRLQRHQLSARYIDVQTGHVTLSDATFDMALQRTPQHIITVHGPQWRLLIIGAGNMSRLLADFALALDYQVSVCDPREEYRQGWGLTAAQLITCMPDDAVIAMQPDARCAIVALAHDPKLDDLALMEALKSPAFYVGALGSRANNAQRRERLKEFDLSQAQVDALHGPVGLNIGSKSAAEIAISIVAEMTSIKNQASTLTAERVRAEKTVCPNNFA